jgi:hypothetical protein
MKRSEGNRRPPSQPIMAARPTAPSSRPVVRRAPLAAAAPLALESDSVAAAVEPAAGVAFVDRMEGPDDAVVAGALSPPETVTASFMPAAQWPAAPQMK